MRILVTGAAGMLGLDLCAAATDAGHELFALARAELDIADAQAVTDALGRVRPDAVVNCAAWTDVDGAEPAEAAATAVNGQGAGNVARAAAEAGAWLVHVSSDYVFDGTKRSPYAESDPTGPLSAYGRSKLAGEHAVASAAPASHTIVRSSWLFGAGGHCFPRTILRLADERDSISVVDDQLGCPTFTGHLAQALLALSQRRVPGVVHVAGGGECTWFQFARQIVAAAGSECSVEPCTTADFPLPAPRPAYSVLRTERGAEVPLLPEWREGLAAFMSALVAAP